MRAFFPNMLVLRACAECGSSWLKLSQHSVVFKLQNDVHIIGIRHDSHDGFSESQQLIAAPRVSESSDVPGVFTPEDLGSFFRKHQHCYFVLGHLGCFWQWHPACFGQKMWAHQSSRVQQQSIFAPTSWGFPFRHGGTPSHHPLGFSLTKAIQLLGISPAIWKPPAIDRTKV